jgi:glycosyltransferase involved in cell wall biosynthesis
MLLDVPRVSIGLPVYNGERFLEIALESILNQTFQDFELVISDNASTDHTREICQEYADKDARVRYFQSRYNYGITRNFNRVFELAKAEYFRWASADDFIALDLVEKCVNVLDSEPDFVLCYAKTVIVDEKGHTISTYHDNLDLRFDNARDRYLHLERNLGLCNAHYGLMRSSILRKTRLLGYYFASDYVFLGELALHGKFYEIPENLFFRRFHAQALSSVKTMDGFSEFYNLYSKNACYLPLWRHLVEKIAVVLRSPIQTQERISLCYLILRHAAENRRAMIRELGTGAVLTARDCCRWSRHETT